MVPCRPLPELSFPGSAESSNERWTIGSGKGCCAPTGKTVRTKKAAAIHSAVVLAWLYIVLAPDVKCRSIAFMPKPPNSKNRDNNEMYVLGFDLEP